MSQEMMLLVMSVGLAFVQVVVGVLFAVRQVGLPILVGNRDALPDFTTYAGRSKRAYQNMFEALAMFAPLVLVANAAGVSNDMTLLGAQLFFFGRIAYAVIYIVGLPWIRTVAWAVAVLGMLLIFMQLI